MSNAGCILVKDIPRGLSSEVIKQYFFSRGGEIKAFQSYENGRKAILEFEDSTGQYSKTSGMLFLVGTIIRGAHTCTRPR